MTVKQVLVPFQGLRINFGLGARLLQVVQPQTRL